MAGVEIVERILQSNVNVEEVVLNNEGIDDLLPLVPLLAKLPNLKRLKLANNNIQKLPDDLSSLKLLEYLDISHNTIPGLGTVIRGLYSLRNLKHLYIDLPYETDEDEIIVSLTALESFNGTPLTEDNMDAISADAAPPAPGMGGMGQQETSPPPPSSAPPGQPQYASHAWGAPPGVSAAPPAPPPSGASPLTQLRTRYGEGGGGGRHGDDIYSPKQAWEPGDTDAVQRLYRAANSVSGRATNKAEFEDYTRNILARLNTLLAGEDDPFRKEAEILKAKKVMFEYCFEEIARSSFHADGNLSSVLTTLQETYAGMLENYDNLLASMQSHKDKKLEVMRRDMQEAIKEIEQLMSQMDSRDSAVRGRDDSDRQQLVSEISWLRQENDKLQARVRQHEVSRQRAATQAEDLSGEWQNGSGPGGSRGAGGSPAGGGVGRGPSVGRSLSLRQLKEIIEDIYASKSKFDIKCSETHLPRETMEQHLYTYLNQKYGLKNLILDWAQAIINGVRKHSAEDNDVAVFGKILRNEIDEEFRFVQRQLKETVHELLRVYLKGKCPLKGDEEIARMLRQRMSDCVHEEEWVDIVKYMYNAEDSVSIIMRVREVIKERNPPRRRTGRRSEPQPRENNAILYQDFLKVLLDFQLQGHERFLAKFVKLFKQYDADRNGILNEAEFGQLLKAIDGEKSEDDINSLLDLIDPHNNQLINFSECVTFLSSELVKMMKENRPPPPQGQSPAYP